MKVGLTGGIGSGKSTIAGFLRNWGAEVIDSDQVARAVVDPGQPAYADIVREFGSHILNADGAIDRGRLGELVFNDDARREKLNQIVHPRVRERWQARAAELESRSPATVVVTMIPLLYETAAEGEFDAVLVVACSPEAQSARLRARGLNDEQIRARVRAQLPTPVKMERADFVIWNDYSLDNLEEQARMVWRELSTSAN